MITFITTHWHCDLVSPRKSTSDAMGVSTRSQAPRNPGMTIR